MNISGKRQMEGIILLLLGLLVIAAFTSLISGCANDDTDAENVAKVKEAFDNYAAAALDGDLESWISLWSEYGRRMAPNAPVSVGVEQIRASVEPGFELFNFVEFDINTEEVQVLGDWAYSHGAYSYSMMPKSGGDAIEDSGKFLTIFEKQDDGSWKIAVDSFSSSLPAP